MYKLKKGILFLSALVPIPWMIIIVYHSMVLLFAKKVGKRNIVKERYALKCIKATYRSWVLAITFNKKDIYPMYYKVDM